MIITDSLLYASLRHAARMALQVLNKYYLFTDHCDVYRVSICMFLSPDSFIAKSSMECSTLASKCITSLITNGLKRGLTRRWTSLEISGHQDTNQHPSPHLQSPHQLQPQWLLARVLRRATSTSTLYWIMGTRWHKGQMSWKNIFAPHRFPKKQTQLAIGWSNGRQGRPWQTRWLPRSHRWLLTISQSQVCSFAISFICN